MLGLWSMSSPQASLRWDTVDAEIKILSVEAESRDVRGL